VSFNGSGTFLINSTGQPVVPGTTISASVFNALTADLANGLTNCITKDGQSTVSNNIPMNNFKFTAVGAGSSPTDSVNLSQVQSGVASLVTVTGTNTYTGTMSPTLAAYAAGNVFTFVVPNTNTTSCTLNIDGLGAKALTRDGSTALVAGDLVANSEILVVYDGTRFQVLNSNSKTNLTLSSGSANQVLYLNASKGLTGSSGLTFNGVLLTASQISTSNFYFTSQTANALTYVNNVNQLVTNYYLTYDGNIKFMIGAPNDNAVTWAYLKPAMIGAGGALWGDGSTPSYAGFSANCYYDGTNWKYIDTDYASQYYQFYGTHIWKVAASGSQYNNITFTTAMSLSATGYSVPIVYSTTVTTPRSVYIDSTGKFGGISSTRVSKINIESLDDVSWLHQLQPMTFNYRKRDKNGAYLDEHETEKQFGMIAEDTAPVAPDLCIYDADGKPIGIHYERLIPVLLKELQKQAERIAVLEAK
jgi:hypothetical protein